MMVALWILLLAPVAIVLAGTSIAVGVFFLSVVLSRLTRFMDRFDI